MNRFSLRPLGFFSALLITSSVLAQATDIAAQGPTRTPQEATRDGLHWLGMLQPLIQGCHVSAGLAQPFIQLSDLMARTAERRGVATQQEIERWKQEGAAKAARLTGGGSLQIPPATCQSIEAGLRSQASTVQATVQQLQAYLKQHGKPAGY